LVSIQQPTNAELCIHAELWRMRHISEGCSW
jgi:hypothetical protein